MAKAKRKLLPKDFDALLREGALEKRRGQMGRAEPGADRPAGARLLTLAGHCLGA